MLIDLNLSNQLFIYQFLSIIIYLVDANQNEYNLFATSLNAHYPDDQITPFGDSSLSINDLNRIVKRDVALNRQPGRTSDIVEINSLNDESTFSFPNSNGIDTDDKNLIRYSEGDPDFEYSPNSIDDNIENKPYQMASAEVEFEYDNQKAWPAPCNDPNALQSPIFLSSKYSRLDQNSKLDIGIKYAKNLPTVEFENKGHTVQFEIPKEAGDLVVTGPGLNYEMYKAEAVHFHWELWVIDHSILQPNYKLGCNRDSKHYLCSTDGQISAFVRR